jgi:hypothetical protein
VNSRIYTSAIVAAGDCAVQTEAPIEIDRAALANPIFAHIGCLQGAASSFRLESAGEPESAVAAGQRADAKCSRVALV